VLEALAVVLDETELNLVERVALDPEGVVLGEVTVWGIEEDRNVVEDNDDVRVEGGTMGVVVVVDDGFAVVEVIVSGEKDEEIDVVVGAGDVKPPQVQGPAVPNGI
jgi:hypothetical protein